MANKKSWQFSDINSSCSAVSFNLSNHLKLKQMESREERT